MFPRSEVAEEEVEDEEDGEEDEEAPNSEEIPVNRNLKCATRRTVRELDFMYADGSTCAFLSIEYL